MARIDAILKLVQEQGASDLHMTTGAPPMVRLNGEITPIPYEELTREVNELLLYELMDAEAREAYALHKDVDFSYEVPGVMRVRCNIYEQSKGMAGAFRLLPSRIPTLEELQLPAAVRGLAELSSGLVLVAGPPGAGKSSTLAALLDHVNRTRRRHVLTIEQPIEFRHRNHLSLVTQREVGRNTAGFARALRAALREDPDVILVGDMPDPETMALTISAAATGQLVFASLRTMSAPQTVDHILDSFGGERQAQVRLMLAESLRGVLAQRLLPRRDGGGRALAMEILLGDPTVQALIRDRKTFQLTTAMQTGRRDGMRSMDDSVASLVREGTVDPEEAAAHLSSAELADAVAEAAAAAAAEREAA